MVRIKPLKNHQPHYKRGRKNPAPLNHLFTVEHGTVCFDDLALRYGITAQATAYRVTSFDRSGTRLATGRIATGFAGHTCTGALTTAGDRDAYTILEVTTLRPELAGRTLVHLARDHATGELRVIGIWRP